MTTPAAVSPRISMTQWLKDVTGFKKYLTLFALGALMTLTLPPIGIFPLLLISIPAFITIAQSASTRVQSFFAGWAFGAGFFVFGLYWISAALFVDIQQWKWVLPLSLIVGPVVLSLFWGFIPLLAHGFREHKIPHALVIVITWGLIEWIRGHVLTGFPWNLAGYTWHHAPAIMQASALMGIYGLTLLTVFFAALPVYASDKKLMRFSLSLFIGLAIFGLIRMNQHPLTQNKDYTLRLVQANIPQMTKWNPDEDWRNIEKHAMLSTAATPATFVVWPETAVTSDLSLFPDIANYIGMKLPDDSIGVLGNLRITYDDQRRDHYHNSVIAMDTKGKVLAAYNKFHLVPFGEYIPFRQTLNMTPIALSIARIGDFTPGDGNKTLRVAGLPAFSPLVCYEGIFPHEVIDQNDRPEWMVNVTNDGWYGKTAGPHQHLEIVRVRAIEEGLPLARAANTGISAVVDPLGRIIGSLALGTEGTLDTILPAPLPPTLYARLGDNVFFVMLCLIGGLAASRLKYISMPKQ